MNKRGDLSLLKSLFVVVLVLAIMTPLYLRAQDSFGDASSCIALDADGDKQHLAQQGEFIDDCPCDDDREPGARGYEFVYEGPQRESLERLRFFTEVLQKNGYESVMPIVMKDQISSFLRDPTFDDTLRGIPGIRLSLDTSTTTQGVQIFDNKAFCTIPTGDNGGCTVQDFELTFFTLDDNLNPQIACRTKDYNICEQYEAAMCNCQNKHPNDELKRQDCEDAIDVDGFTALA